MRTTFLFFVIAGFPTGVCAGGFESPGVGAKAISMGGAFIGLADDWTATFWNPAGLAQLHGTAVGNTLNQLSSKTFSQRSMGNPFLPLSQENIDHADVFFNSGTEPAQFNAMTSKTRATLPAFGVYHQWGPWVGAISLHSPLGFSSRLTDSTIPGLNASFEGEGFLLMSGISIAREINSRVLLGAGFHVLTGHLEREAVKSASTYEYRIASSSNDPAVPEGVLGLLIRLTSRLRLGMVYRTPATLHLSGEAQVSDTRFPLTTSLGTLQNEKSTFTTDIYNPATYGVGVAYAISPQWLTTLDWQGTDWRPTRHKITFDSPGAILQSHDVDAHWGFTHRIRGGLEYRPQTQWSFRVGIARDPQALPDSEQSLTNQVDITRYFYTTGFGWSSQKSWDLDFGYQYGYGSRTIDGTLFRRESHSFLFGLQYHFV